MSQRALRRVGLDGQLGIELMVERAAAGEAPSSPQPPEAGARGDVSIGDLHLMSAQDRNVTLRAK